MAMPHLLDALRRDAQTEIAAIDAEADERVAQLKALATRDRGERIRVEVERVRRDLQDQADTRVAQAALAARRARLEARHEMLGRVRRAARSKLPGLLERPGLTAALVDAAVAAAGDRAARLRCSQAVAGAARERAGGLPVEVDPSCGSGAIVELADERGAVDATLEAFFDRAWPVLRIASLNLVDGEPS